MKEGASSHSYPHLEIEQRGSVAIILLNRSTKRNAVNDEMLRSIERFFREPPDGTRTIVLGAYGDHFSAGLDLSEHRERDAFETMAHSQWWHKTFELIQYGQIPVVCAMKGAVIGGGLELAASTHVRVASQSSFYALPEGQRGIFVGGGATVRLGRIIGTSRMVEMMLTARAYTAEEGHALGLSHYLVAPGQEMTKALELAEQIAGNAQVSNYAILNAIGKIADMGASDGLFVESLMAALVQTGPEVQERLNAFLDRKQGKVQVR